jgi:hypothetical protein
MDNITISLSKEQRDLLLKYEPFFSSHELFRLISIAVKRDKNYELTFTEDQLDEFLEQLAELCNNEEDEEAQYKLDDLYDSIEQYSDTYDDGYGEYSNNTGSVCLLKVFLAYEKKIWRTIAVREGQTLHDLHNIIFDAFDREEEHMYSFFFPHFPHKKLNIRKLYQNSDEYTHPYACEDPGPFSSEGKNAAKTTIQSLDLTEGQVFYYIFDFGDEWWHEITVEEIDLKADDGDYPRIIEQKGESPEQYGYPDDEDF